MEFTIPKSQERQTILYIEKINYCKKGLKNKISIHFKVDQTFKTPRNPLAP